MFVPTTNSPLAVSSWRTKTRTWLRLQATGVTRRLALDDIYSLQLPTEPAISPDGRQVIYALRTTDPEMDADRYALWSLRATPEGWDAPVQLTRGTNDTSPAFSPSGDRVAFLRGGDGQAQLHMLPVNGGEAQRLTELPAGAGAPVWSPDGNRIAFTAAVRRGPDHDRTVRGGKAMDSGPGPAGDPAAHAPIRATRLGYKADGAGLLRTRRQHVHMLDLATGEVRQLTDGDWHAGRPAWSPDGARLAFAAGTEPDADITFRTPPHVLDLAGGEPPRRAGNGLDVAGPMVWTADGALLVVGQRIVAPGHAGLFLLPVEGVTAGDVRDVAGPLDRNVMSGGPGYPGGLPQLTADHRSVVFCVRATGAARTSTRPRSTARVARVRCSPGITWSSPDCRWRPAPTSPP